MTTVLMINSVDEHVAGESVELPTEVADRFIALGYAEGELSRPLSTEEVEALKATTQEVSL